jgi:hypothetical protein
VHAAIARAYGRKSKIAAAGAMRTMAQINRRTKDRVSKSRVLNALILTVFTVAMAVAWWFHAWWALRVVLDRTYGGLVTCLVYGPGTFVAGVGLGIKVVLYLNAVLIEDRLDTDHKKYL